MQSNAERPIAYVAPFSINGQYICNNCENFETITDKKMVFCSWCKKNYKIEQDLQEVTESPTSPPLRRRRISSNSTSPHQVSYSERSRSSSPELFSQEGQRWDLNSSNTSFRSLSRTPSLPDLVQTTSLPPTPQISSQQEQVDVMSPSLL